MLSILLHGYPPALPELQIICAPVKNGKNSRNLSEFLKFIGYILNLGIQK